MGFADIASSGTPWSKILLRSAQAAQRVAANQQVPHNPTKKASVTQARKTPSTAGMNITQAAAQNAGAAPTQNTTSGTGTTVPTEQAQTYDGSTAANPTNFPGQAPVEATSAASMWNLQNDPTYQAAIASGQSTFNIDKMNALANLQNQQISAQQNLTQQNQNAAQSRRQLAGNFAARGMQGGAHGAYYRAQDQANADLITAQTSTKDQLAALNQDFLSKYGGVGADWTSTAVGQQYKNQATQQALSALTSRYTGV
jgi:trehalose-6-phosphatase